MKFINILGPGLQLAAAASGIMHTKLLILHGIKSLPANALGPGPVSNTVGSLLNFPMQRESRQDLVVESFYW